MPITLRRAVLALAPLVALAACGRDVDTPDQAAAGGTVVIAGADPDALFPPTAAQLQDKTIIDLVFDPLAVIGEKLNTVGDAGFTPRLADRWSWAPDSLSIAFHVDPRARWHDGQPVRAEDVRFTFAAFTDSAVASPHAENLREIDSVTVRDSATAVFWFKRRSPEQFFNAVYHMTMIPAHRFKGVAPGQYATSDAARTPVGTGQFRFVKWTPGSAVEVVADTANYRGRPGLDRVVWSVVTDARTAPARLFTGAADFYERLTPETMTEVAAHRDVKVTRYDGLDYAYLSFNLTDGASARPHPLFGDRELRRALTRALDRRAMLRNVFDSLAVFAYGPFVRAWAAADTTVPQLAYDSAGAARTLDSLGWKDANGDGVRERNGRPLAFTISVTATSAPRMKYAVLIQEQLARVGAKVSVQQLDAGAVMAQVGSGKFDAFIGSWHVDPSPSGVRQFWTTSASRAAHGFNFGSYSSPAFDAVVDSAVAAFDPDQAKAYYRRAWTTIVQDAPAAFLYEPRPAAGMHHRLQPVGMRADAWWANIGRWSIPPGERIDRDRIGLRTASR